MLIGNRSVLLKSPGRYFGGSTVSDNRSAFGTSGSTRCRYFGGFPSTSATPTGYRPPYSWIIAIKNGEMSAVNSAFITLSASGSGASGFAIDGTAAITFTVPDAEGRLVTGGTGTASFSITATSDVYATLGTSGSSSFTFTTNAPILKADGFMGADAPFVINATIASYAKGFMSGTTVDNSVLTVDAIAAGVLAAALTSPIASDIKKMNGVTVIGVGTTGDKWRA